MAKEQWETYFNAVKKEDWKTAKNFLQVISKQEKNNSQTFMKIGDVCQRTGDKTEAIAAYTHAAQLLRMQGFAQKALATYKIALRLDPTNPEIIRRAELLMDEFEAAKTAPHRPALRPAEPHVAEELHLPAEEPAPAEVEVPQPSDWLERTAVSPDSSESDNGTTDTLSSDMASMLERTSFETETPLPQEEISSQVQTPATSGSELPAEETASNTDTLQAFEIPVPEEESDQIQLTATTASELPAPELVSTAFNIQETVIPSPAPTEATDENGEWLQSAYDALDSRMFKPQTDRSAGAEPPTDDDAIHLIYGQKPGESDDDITEAIEEFLVPLSERQERSIPEIFRDLPNETVTSFMNDLTVRKFKDKQHVIEEGDAGDSMYIIKSGSTRVVAHMLGRELELAVLGEGDVFGEVGFLTGRPRTAAVIASGPLQVYEISRLDIERLIEINPDIIARIEDFYETRVRDTINKIKS